MTPNMFTTLASLGSFYKWGDLRALGSMLMEIDLVLMILEYTLMFSLLLRYNFSLWVYVVVLGREE